METVESYLKKGDSLRAEGNWEEALEYYQKVIELDPENWLAYHHSGDALLSLAKYEAAIDCYQRSLRINASFIWSYYNLGVALLRTGQVEKALNYHQKVTELNTDFWKLNKVDFHIQHQIGDFCFEHKNFDQAIVAYYRAIDLNPESPWSYCNLGRTFHYLGKLEKALLSIRKATEIAPDFAWGYYYLGKVLLSLGESEEAISAYRKALEINPHFLEVIHTLKRLLDSDKKSRESEEIEEYSQKIKESWNNFKVESSQLYILQAHVDDPSGLGVVARQCDSLGKVVANSQEVTGKVLVPGRPDLYHELVDDHNINYLWMTFESSRIPASWVEIINQKFTKVFVPHPYVLQALQKSGVECPVEVIPQGYPERKRVKPINKEANRLKLGFLGGPNYRKNIDSLIEAIILLREDGHNIELMIHCPWIGNYDPQQNSWGDLPGIHLSTGNLSDEEINQWYSELDAYIYPSSGEGWSFTPREAMSLGIPTIISDIPVHQELTESGYFIPIRSERWESAYFEFLQDTCGEWKSYSIIQIRDAIVEMIENYDYWQEQANQGKNFISELSWTWNQIHKELLQNIFPTAKQVSHNIIQFFEQSQTSIASKNLSDHEEYDLDLTLSGIIRE